MSPYPPLTDVQIYQLNCEIDELYTMMTKLGSFRFEYNGVMPHEEDLLTREVAELRGLCQKLDLRLFQMFGLVHALKNANVSTKLPTAAPKPSLESLSDLLT